MLYKQEDYYYNVAGIKLKIDGLREYSVNRMVEYSCEPCEVIDIYISINIRQEPIKLSFDEKNSVSDGIFSYAKVDGGLVSYRFIPQLGAVTHTIEFDREYKNVNITVYDVDSTGIFNEPLLDIYTHAVLGEAFGIAILKHNRFTFHSSSIYRNGRGLAFSAPSGTGKSTHTTLWEKTVDGTKILNDDKPVITFNKNDIIISGSPWSGKTEFNKNISVPLDAIVFLQRAKENSIIKLGTAQAISRILTAVKKPPFEETMDLCLDMMSQLTEKVPAYLLSCNISEEAVYLVKETVGW